MVLQRESYAFVEQKLWFYRAKSMVLQSGSYALEKTKEEYQKSFSQTTNIMKESTKTGKERADYQSAQQQVAFEVEDFLNKHYWLRYNVMTQKEEYCPKEGNDSETPPPDDMWKPLTKRMLNQMVHEQMRLGGTSWDLDITRFIQSTMVPDYNPLFHYLQKLPKWNRHYDYIGSMARRIPTDNHQFAKLFHRWFLAMVAQWLGLNRDHGNAVVLMLVGSQGQMKSTFCKKILPPCLRDYYIDDIKMDNPEQVERVLCRMALVNIDEYNAKTPREQAKIKRILTERDVQVRPMRSSEYTVHRRMASFTATTNERYPLTDPTGSRRYLCVAVKGCIQIARPVKYDKMYAQALYELQNGEPYWFSHREEACLNENNRQFQHTSTTDELLLSFYQPAETSVKHFIRIRDMLDEMKARLPACDVPPIRKLIYALKRNGFSNGVQHNQRGWYAIPVR